ncbi:hypothetical protein [Alkalihalobacillus sp. BA299]|uniref:hypothetical protein n=1 Tax=Alkalihalobacillus sp. BA299 TaxID=2815938 RepID=UPI001ADBAB6A|nr:hypothetical protein [Alkalihalobacillus sp. BA299]
MNLDSNKILAESLIAKVLKNDNINTKKKMKNGTLNRSETASKSKTFFNPNNVNNAITYLENIISNKRKK